MRRCEDRTSRCSAVALVCVLIVTAVGCSPGAPKTPKDSKRGGEITVAELLVVQAGKAHTSVQRFGPPSARETLLGAAMSARLGFEVAGARVVQDELIREASAEADTPRGLAESALSAAIVGRLATARRLFVSVDRKIARSLPKSLSTADGQAAILMLATLARLLREAPKLTQAASCPSAESMPATVEYARQLVVLGSLGCEVASWEESTLESLGPSSVEGCTLFLVDATAVRVLGRSWVESCWRDAYGFLFQGRDARAVSDVLPALVIAPEQGSLPRGQAERELAIVGARFWRFGGGVSPFGQLDLRLALRAQWLAETLIGKEVLRAPNVGSTLRSRNPKDIVFLGAIGAVSTESTSFRRAWSEVSPASASRIGFFAVSSRTARDCSVLRSDWRERAAAVVSKKNTTPLMSLVRPFVLERLAECFPGPEGVLRRARSEEVLAELAENGALSTPAELTNAATLLDELCALGVDPPSKLAAVFWREATSLEADQHLGTTNYDLLAYASAVRVRQIYTQGCAGAGWALVD